MYDTAERAESGPAPALRAGNQRRETFASTAEERLQALAARIADMNGRMTGLADAAFGPIPEPPTNGKGSIGEVRSGQFGSVLDRVDLLAAEISRLEATTDRFSGIA
ncbi:MAG TPA: hypothetical protein VGR19_05965 [Allosphingosinicella sp.]|nr:hypothetical protein [Allosphingosinicella sp.]